VGSSANQQVSEISFNKILLGFATDSGIFQEGTQTVNISYDHISGGPGAGANGINMRTGSASILHYAAGDSAVAIRLAIGILLANIQYAEWEGQGNNLTFLLMEDGGGNGNGGPLVTLKDSRLAWSLAGATNVISYGVTTGAGGHLMLSGNKFDGFTGTPQIFVKSPTAINTYFSESGNTYLTMPVVTSGFVQRSFTNPSPDATTGLGLLSSYPLEIDQPQITATTAPPIGKFTTTWNNSSLAGEGLQVNVTNSSSAIASFLLDLQIASATRFGVDKTGMAVFNGNSSITAAAPAVGGSSAGWKYCIFSNTTCTGVATNTEVHLLGANNWLSTMSVSPANNASTTVPDSNAGVSLNANGTIVAKVYSTATNCSVNSVSPAACSAAAAGSFVVPTTTATYTVNTTAVKAASRIFLIPHTDARDLPSAPTCTAVASGFVGVSAIVAATSFTFALPSTTGQTCWDYWIVN